MQLALLIDIIRSINVLNGILANNYVVLISFFFYSRIKIAFVIRFSDKLVQVERETDRSMGAGHNILTCQRREYKIII